jgi:integrase
LRWSDIQDGRAIITRSLTQTKQMLEFKGTKTEKPRDVKVPESALAALEAHRKRQDEFRRQFGSDYRADLDLIFANPDGTPLRPNSISSVVSLLFRRLGLPKGASLHSLRHSHGSHLVADGVPLPVVAERLGHSSIRTTADVYTHALRGQDDDAPDAGMSFSGGEPETVRTVKSSETSGLTRLRIWRSRGGLL